MEMNILVKKGNSFLKRMKRSFSSGETVEDFTSDADSEELVTDFIVNNIADSLTEIEALVKKFSSLLQRIWVSFDLEEEIARISLPDLWALLGLDSSLN